MSEPQVILHGLFLEGSDTEELLSCISTFLDGDCGNLQDDNEVLGFISQSVGGKPRHGVYETKTSGRIHIIGDDTKVMVMPDIIFAQAHAGTACTINTAQQTNQNN